MFYIHIAPKGESNEQTFLIFSFAIAVSSFLSEVSPAFELTSSVFVTKSYFL